MSAATLQETVYLGTGRRKTASARVRLFAGSGNYTVNGKDLATYCYAEHLASAATEPLRVVELEGQYDLHVTVQGGGPESQATAISHGLARALQKMNPDLRPPLKKAGLLTRDQRMKERKKPGQPGARKRFQFSKR